MDICHEPARCRVAFLVCAWLCASPVHAQYFGRNKVQYKQLNFQILKTEHFDIYHYPEAREGIDIAVRLAERWHARLERLLDHQLRGRQPLVLYASHPDFEQTNVVQGEIGEGTGGLTEPVRRRIVQPLGGSLADTDHVIGHELVHAFQFDITADQSASPGQSGIDRIPLWFIEGMAEYLSIGPVAPNTAMWLRDAARKEQLPTIDELADPKYFPYRWGHAFWAYVGGKWGDSSIRPMLAFASAAGDPAVAIQRVLGLTTKEFTEEWHASIYRTYGPVIAATAPPSAVGTLIIKSQKLGGNLNVGPAISPDGRMIAFLSERGFFSIDLFVADATTGKIRHQLTSTATDPHYSSIQFLYSAGGWDADSRRLAIATITDGRPALAIFDAQSGDREHEIKVPGVDEIFNPTWSPDGRAICFTGMSRGLTDLFVVDVESGALRQLTTDPFSDLQPAWSPDGRFIAFATDRFSSNLGTLAIGDYRLALLDPATGRIQQPGSFTTGNSINPQWAPDSRSLFFIGDRDGIPNLYRSAIDTDEVTQLTRATTGLSGITGSSPALSVASRAGIAAFSLYDEGNYDIYTLAVSGSAAPVSTARQPLSEGRGERCDAAAGRTQTERGSGLAERPHVRFGPRAGLRAVQLQTAVVARANGSTNHRGGRRPIRRRGRRRPGVLIQRHAGESPSQFWPSAQFRIEHQLQPEEHRRTNGLPQSIPPLELGRRARPGAVFERGRPGIHQRGAGPAVPDQRDDPLQAD